MDDINTAKARRLMTMAGLLIVGLAGERAALHKLAAQGGRRYLRKGIITQAITVKARG